MISLAEYSDKSFVVNGSTIDYKNKLKDLGGKWNPYLKTGPGWIFSNKRKSSVQDWMNNIELVVSPPQKRRKLNNIKEVNVSNLQILKDVVLAIFVVSLIYLFNMYASNNIDFKNTLYAYLYSGRAALAQSTDYLNSYLYKFKVYTPTFLNNTC